MTRAVELAQVASTGVSEAFKNRIINGAMTIDQRNAGASVNPLADIYTLDRWRVYRSSDNRMTIQQNAGSVTPPAGFNNYLGITSSSAYSVGANDYFLLEQPIEGFNFADLNFGTANAKTFTLSFWVRSSLTGTFTGAFTNEAYNRTFAFTYTILAANTWELKSITVVGDTTGTWTGANNAIGIRMRFVIGAGSNRLTASTNQWIGGGADGASGSVSLVGTNGATLYITGVQLEVGSTATSFEYLDYGRVLQQCQRYFIRTNPTAANGSGGLFGAYFSSTAASVSYNFPVTMRAAPTVTRSSAGNNGDTFWVSNISATSAGTSGNVNTGTTGIWQEVSGMSSASIGYPVAYNGSLQINAEL